MTTVYIRDNVTGLERTIEARAPGHEVAAAVDGLEEWWDQAQLDTITASKAHRHC